MTEPLVRLLYVSAASPLLTAAGVAFLHRRAETANAARGITGALLHYGGHFLQALEGSPAAVHELYDRIAVDRRHRDPRLLVDGAVSERCFAAWSMRRVDPPRSHDRAVIAFLDALHGERGSAAQAPMAVELLRRLAGPGAAAATSS